jgi:glyoxylase-like metal-dependent hydrolase (beta-lactamase superfamily II)
MPACPDPPADARLPMAACRLPTADRPAQESPVKPDRAQFLLAVSLALIAGAAVPRSAAAQPRAPGTDTADPARVAPGGLRTDTHALEELAPGVFFASGTGKLNVASNALVVVNAEDVLVVDSHITPDAARALLDSVARLTDKPLRYLVNSHFHFDHVHGNQAFPEGIEIIGHEVTRERLLGDVLREPTYLTIGGERAVARQITALEARARAASGAERTALEAQLAMQRRHLGALAEVRPTPPNLTLTEKLTLHRGGREIRILHLGRGHTGGDLVVHLPAERIAFTGDLFYGGAPYLGDGYPQELVDTLELLKSLDAEVLVGGHGPPIRDRAVIDRAQAYLRSYWSQVSRFHEQGLSVEEATDRLDLSGYERWAAFQLGNPEVLGLEVARMYYLLSGGD